MTKVTIAQARENRVVRRHALKVAAAVDATMKRLSQRFPDGLRYDVPFNTTRFIEASIHEVIKTLVEAIMFVVLVVFWPPPLLTGTIWSSAPGPVGA